MCSLSSLKYKFCSLFKKIVDFEEDGSQNAKICVGNRDVLAVQYQQEMEPPMRHYIICK